MVHKLFNVKGGLSKVPAFKQDFGKRQQVGRIRLTSDPTLIINPQPHVHDLLRPNQPMYLIDTGASASIIGIDMLTN